jgi:hypothetical protein
MSTEATATSGADRIHDRRRLSGKRDLSPMSDISADAPEDIQNTEKNRFVATGDVRFKPQDSRIQD